ncbi:MAG: M15 family metallopeptidase [Paracoccaceae bacterium]
MQQSNLIAPIIIAIGLVVAAIVFAIVGVLLQTADVGTELRVGRVEEQLQTSQVEQGRLDSEIRQLRTDISRLKDDMAVLAAQSDAGSAPIPSNNWTNEEQIGEHTDTEELTEEMQLAKTRFNTGITQPRNRTMLDVLGHPRASYGTNCQPVTNAKLKALMETRQVGPIRVTMIKPALESLERIMARLQDSDPDIYAAVGTAGAICARLIRGSRSSVSNHSWGTAIDVKLEGKLDGFGDGGTQFGLLILAELFNEEGWFWGATYNREDSMHFEVGEETLRRWAAEGQL